MLQWLSANTQWLFDGIATAVVVTLAGWLLRRIFSRSSDKTQTQTGGSHSVNVQAGRDSKVGDITNRDR